MTPDWDVCVKFGNACPGVSEPSPSVPVPGLSGEDRNFPGARASLGSGAVGVPGGRECVRL